MKPLFMWAGGKTKVIKHYLPYMPTEVDTYYEPFFGGGAMFIHMMNEYNPRHVFINDINNDIMQIYRSVRDRFASFCAFLNVYEEAYIPLNKSDRKKYYYDLRYKHAYDYEAWDEHKTAATLYFLMKTGFNGIFQINKNTNNRYGTPSGLLNQKTQVYDRNVLQWWHDALQGVTISSKDWKESVDEEDAFYFFDPPYRTSFADYGNSFDDQSLQELITFSERQSLAFICNRADDDYFDKLTTSLRLHYFNVTYTAGRRKQVDDTFKAKKAREVLLYKTDRVTLEELAYEGYTGTLCDV